MSWTELNEVSESFLWDDMFVLPQRARLLFAVLQLATFIWNNYWMVTSFCGEVLALALCASIALIFLYNPCICTRHVMTKTYPRGFYLQQKQRFCKHARAFWLTGLEFQKFVVNIRGERGLWHSTHCAV